MIKAAVLAVFPTGNVESMRDSVATRVPEVRTAVDSLFGPYDVHPAIANLHRRGAVDASLRMGVAGMFYDVDLLQGMKKVSNDYNDMERHPYPGRNLAVILTDAVCTTVERRNEVASELQWLQGGKHFVHFVLIGASAEDEQWLRSITEGNPLADVVDAEKLEDQLVPETKLGRWLDITPDMPAETVDLTSNAAEPVHSHGSVWKD